MSDIAGNWTLGRIILWLVIGLTAVLIGLYSYLVYAPNPQRPVLRGELLHRLIQVGGLQREYLVYLPAKRQANADLVVVAHASNQNVEGMRVATAYEFERLADLHGFVLVYPEGIGRSWNDCRRIAPYTAKKENIDDVGFIQALISRAAEEYGINPGRAFLAGYSNGGQLGYRIALENPLLLRAVAAIAASLPTAENSDCRPSGEPASVLVMNGTADPINPYNGGQVALLGFGNRGNVLSSRQTAEYFASLAHAQAQPSESLAQSPAVRVDRWRSGVTQVELYSIGGGGHVVPQPLYRSPRVLGKNLAEFNGPEAIWAFFARQF